MLEAFTAKEAAQSFKVTGFDHFHGKVIYMNVAAPKQTYMMIRRLQDQLRTVPWLTFNKNEFPITLHATICYPKTPEQCREILHSLRHEQTALESSIDVLTLMRRDPKRWRPIRPFPLLQREA